MSIIRASLCVLALLAPFFFPWPYVIVCALIAALGFPPMALIVGILTDLLYSHGSMIPYFTIYGAIGSVLAYIVHQFVKTRIMF